MVNENEEPLQFASETKPLSIMSSLKTTGLQTKSLVLPKPVMKTSMYTIDTYT